MFRRAVQTQRGMFRSAVQDDRRMLRRAVQALREGCSGELNRTGTERAVQESCKGRERDV